MQGRTVALAWPRDEHYALMSSWLAPTSTVVALTGDANEFLSASTLRDLNESGSVRYLMVCTSADEPIGMVNYRRVGSAGSYSIAGAVADTEKWGAGVGAEAVGLVVDLLFHSLAAHRVEFTTASFNRHTLSILTRGGFVLEGVLRDYYFLDGEYHDRTVWSILRDEFCRHAAADQVFGVVDAVPRTDKDQARAVLGAYLAEHRDDLHEGFEARRARPRAY